tara:strand:+ start:156 stop:386 length:231 start_codon:yes stop_codon:yes gene_type:complete
MSPAEGEAGRVTVIAPLEVFKKYPLPEATVKGPVFAVVHQLTVPVLPKPVCVAPEARLTAPPHLPNVIVAPSKTTV